MDKEGEISVSLSYVTWAEVCAALRRYINTDAPKASSRDALYALRVIDATMMGSEILPSPDEVL